MFYSGFSVKTVPFFRPIWQYIYPISDKSGSQPENHMLKSGTYPYGYLREANSPFLGDNFKSVGGGEKKRGLGFEKSMGKSCDSFCKI